MAAGQPTKYKPEIIDKINKYLESAIPENMKIPTIEGIALELGINRDTLYEWAKVHPEFSDTLDRLRMKQKEALIQTGIFGGKEINQTIVSLLLKVNHDMIVTERKEITGKDGQPFSINIIADYISQSKPDATPISGSEGSHTLQSTNLAQTSKKDINSAGEISNRGA